MNIAFYPKINNEARMIEGQYTKVPNIIFDEIMFDVSPNAFKCLHVILRCTIGYQRESFSISSTEFQKITGIKRRETINSAIKELEQLLIISVDRSAHTNIFFLTLSLYEKTVQVRKNRTEFVCTKKPYIDSTENAYIECTKKPYTNKERKKKENIYSNSQGKAEQKTTNEKTDSDNQNSSRGTIQKTTSKKTNLDIRKIDLPENVNRDAWVGFVEMRASIKKPLTERAANIFIEKLKTFGALANTALDNSTLHNWQGIFLPQGQESPQKQLPPAQAKPIDPSEFDEL